MWVARSHAGCLVVVTLCPSAFFSTVCVTSPPFTVVYSVVDEKPRAFLTSMTRLLRSYCIDSVGTYVGTDPAHPLSSSCRTTLPAVGARPNDPSSTYES